MSVENLDFAMQLVWFIGISTYSDLGHVAAMVEAPTLQLAISRVLQTVVGEWEVNRLDVVQSFPVGGGPPLEYYREHQANGICWI